MDKISVATHEQKTLTFFTMNLSGMKSKIHNINNILTQNHFHIYAIQETWLNSTVTSEEIIAGTNYSIIRNDRSTFLSNRKNGGGVAILIHNSIKYAQIDILIPTIIEIQVCEIIIDPTPIILVNFYIAPNRARNVQSTEFNRILTQIRLDFPSHYIILTGDVNTPTIQWKFDTDLNQLVIKDEINLPPGEKRFYHICVTNGLTQHNNITNSRGTTLDWILSNTYISNIQVVPGHLSLDNPSQHHKPISFEIAYVELPPDEKINNPQYDYTTTKLNHTKWELTEYDFPQITNSDGAYYYTNDESRILNKLENFAEVLLNVQNKYTKLRRRNTNTFDTGHPWTKDRRIEQIGTPPYSH